MQGPPSVVTPARFFQGMTFDQYVSYVGSPENLEREAGWWAGSQRVDFSGLLRDRYARLTVTDAQVAAIRWLAAQPGGPRNVLVISEEWSSDCRRDVPMLARLAEGGALELRIFPRDGRTVSRGARATSAESPNADLVNAFLNVKDGQTFQSVPVAVFLTDDFRTLYRYVEYPAIYHKDRLWDAMQARAASPRDGAQQARERFLREWGMLQQSPFFDVWTAAAADEIIAGLYEARLLTT